MAPAVDHGTMNVSSDGYRKRTSTNSAGTKPQKKRKLAVGDSIVNNAQRKRSGVPQLLEETNENGTRRKQKSRKNKKRRRVTGVEKGNSLKSSGGDSSYTGEPQEAKQEQQHKSGHARKTSHDRAELPERPQVNNGQDINENLTEGASIRPPKQTSRPDEVAGSNTEASHNVDNIASAQSNNHQDTNQSTVARGEPSAPRPRPPPVCICGRQVRLSDMIEHMETSTDCPASMRYAPAPTYPGSNVQRLVPHIFRELDRLEEEFRRNGDNRYRHGRFEDEGVDVSTPPPPAGQFYGLIQLVDPASPPTPPLEDSDTPHLPAEEDNVSEDGNPGRFIEESPSLAPANDPETEDMDSIPSLHVFDSPSVKSEPFLTPLRPTASIHRRTIPCPAIAQEDEQEGRSSSGQSLAPAVGAELEASSSVLPKLESPQADAEQKTTNSPSPAKKSPKKPPTTPRKTTGKSSHYFPRTPTPKKKPYRAGDPVVPPAPLTSLRYGLFQELVAHDPWKVILGCIFVTRTRANVALPEFWQLLQRYPTPDDLAAANRDDILPIFKKLGLPSRADAIIELSKQWIACPPAQGRRYRTLNYPVRGAHAGIGATEVLTDTDPRPGAFEIGHLNNCAGYVYDSWRIFCRDELRGLAADWDRGGNTDPKFVPEWMRVNPNDKELKEYVRWLWLKEGFEWDDKTGERRPAAKDVQREALERPKRVIGETEWLGAFWDAEERERERLRGETGVESGEVGGSEEKPALL